MRKFTLYILWAICLMVSCSTEQEEKSGLLWKITSKDGREAFLYGTMHVYPQNQFSISEKVISSLTSCKVLAIERNFRDEDDQRLFLQNNKHKFGAKAYQVIASKYGGDLKNMEAELVSVADSNGIGVTGLETARELLAVLDSIPVQQKVMNEDAILRQAKQLIELYKGEQIGYLADTVLDQELGREVRELLVDKRNMNWLDDIEGLIKKEKTFIAVGVGHLGGEKGLISLLKKKGYKLERVRI